jgi:electron transport complex protein RnfE
MAPDNCVNKNILKEFSKGITVQNPTFGLILGLCPTLAVSTSLFNALGMGLAATFVLVFSNVIISALRNFIPAKIRLPSYIVIIATFVTVCELMIKAYLPALSVSLGIFIPLIVVNCIIMARAEAFACRNSVLPSLFDGLGMGAGFTLGISIIAFIRELLGSASIAGHHFLKTPELVLIMMLAPGALLTMGLLIGLSRLIGVTKK